ncbi:MAG TPA: YCF48-related protein [Pyrinomonadaceae bacterium]|nr:YCF48-related protein [Pyrinomonadaceae bacterium]
MVQSFEIYYMKCYSILLLSMVMLGGHGAAFPQFANQRPARVSTYSEPFTAGQSQSTGGITYRSVATDKNGSVWIGGKILEQGLLLQVDPALIPISLPKIPSVQRISFSKPGSGWFISQGILYSLSDSGWAPAAVSEQGSFGEVYFLNHDLGWVIGDGGRLYKTLDGGRTWHRKKSGVSANLQKIQFVNPLDGWVTGVSGDASQRPRVFLITRNGGDSWVNLSSNPFPAIYAFSFVNEFEGWSIDENNNVLQTTDGGRTWSLQRKGGRENWNDVHFISNEQGWLAGDGILSTRDGGKTWTSQLASSGGDAERFLDQILFIDNRRGWAVGLFRVLYTRDGGKQWCALPDKWEEAALSRVLKEMKQR